MAARPKLSLPPTPQIGQVILRLCRRQPTFLMVRTGRASMAEKGLG
jgi:hypothetical protein